MRLEEYDFVVENVVKKLERNVRKEIKNAVEQGMIDKVDRWNFKKVVLDELFNRLY